MKFGNKREQAAITCNSTDDSQSHYGAKEAGHKRAYGMALCKTHGQAKLSWSWLPLGTVSD